MIDKKIMKSIPQYAKQYIESAEKVCGYYWVTMLPFDDDNNREPIRFDESSLADVIWQIRQYKKDHTLRGIETY